MKKMLTISTKGQVTLPKKARTAMGLLPGQRLTIESVGNDSITLKRVKDIVEFRGVLKDVYPQDAVKHIREIRDSEWEQSDSL